MQRFLNQHILPKESRFLKSVGKDRGAPHTAPVHRAGHGGVVFSRAPTPPYQHGRPLVHLPGRTCFRDFLQKQHVSTLALLTPRARIILCCEGLSRAL